jgi:trigger factor
MVPAGMIRKMHGAAIFTDEVLKTIEKELNAYMTNEKLEIFAQPLPLADNNPGAFDLNNPGDYSFSFEIGLKSPFTVVDLPSLKADRYKVAVTDTMVEDEVNRLQVRHGKMTDPDTTTGDDNVINVTFQESDVDGNLIEGGAAKDNSLLIKYFAPSFRSSLLGKQKDDNIVLQLNQAFDAKEREWVMSDLGFEKNDSAAGDKYFKMVITKVGMVENAELNEDFFNIAFPNKAIATTEEFKTNIRQEQEAYWDKQASNHLQHELYHTLLDKTHIAFPETFLKRWLQEGGEKRLSAEEAEAELPKFMEQLKWSLVTDSIIRDKNIQVAADDLKAFAKEQLMGYMGMNTLDENQPWITDYINRMMNDRKFVEDSYQRILVEKVLGWAETEIGKNEKPVSVEEFMAELEKHKHHHH